MSGSNKMYGLLAPKKGVLQTRHAVFEDDSPDEGGGGGGPVAQAKARKARAVAAELDPALLQYDEYHDELERERAEQQKVRRESAKARYIPLLMQQADRRKKEAERRAERLVQKERESEGDQFRDKETFVTSSYRKKVEEFAKMDAEDKMRDRIEELADVTKQKDLGAFYGSLYKQTVDANNVEVKVELDGEEGKAEHVKEGKVSGKKSRHYRKRKNSSSEEEHSDDTNEIDREIVGTVGYETREGSEDGREQHSARRKDDERSRSTSKRKKSRETGESKIKEDVKGARYTNHVDGAATETPSNKCVESGSEEGEIREEEEKKKNTNSGDDTTKSEVQVTEKLEPVANTSLPQIEKVNIWEKHTVGEVFVSAVQRYWQRKAARDAGR